mmetsp:Transcript_107390/g.326403  ORF Transcript_107390/g.326403 Transcript_107390/m.326403 type:complete len:274 (+) Transcript_107390:1-822(+)
MFARLEAHCPPALLPAAMFHACASSCSKGGGIQTDTVKVNFSSLAAIWDKENAAPDWVSPRAGQQKLQAEEAWRREEEEWRRRQTEERERCRRLAEAEEQHRRQAEAEHRQRLEADLQQRSAEELRREAAERRRREEEERKRRDAEERRCRRELEERLLAEREQRLEEERRREEEARLEAERASKRDRLERVLLQVGFGSVNERKKTSGVLSSGFTYPLHAAVKAADVEAVELLLWGGADRTLKDSAKRTPLALALKLNRRDSHKAVGSLLVP